MIRVCVGDTAMSREVLVGTDGVIEGARPGTVVADASTISPSESREIGKTLKERGVDFLDAPCTGGWTKAYLLFYAYSVIPGILVTAILIPIVRRLRPNRKDDAASA